MADEGATPRELILEACRRNNPDLLLEVLAGVKPTSPTSSHEDAVADLLNNARDGMGNAALHVAAGAGSYETLDVLLDQPGVETDPITRLTQDTPLHSAVAHLNSLPLPPQHSSNSHYNDNDNDNDDTTTSAFSLVEILLDAGCDPRIRNKARRKPVECVDPRNEALKAVLRRAEVLMVEGEGIAEGMGVEDGGDVEEEERRGGVGSESD